MKTVFSGIQPSGDLHIGNYIGAISQWIKLQEEREAIFCIVDLHAITVPQDPKVLKEKSLEVAALYLACGLDPKKAHIFIQSENPNHPYLSWILNTITPFGQLRLMTQFKVKAKQLGDHESSISGVKDALEDMSLGFNVNVGLFDYPVLMAADILLYQTDEVPVGEDQKQHIELARDLAEKFNKKFGETLKIPNPLIQKQTARIMSLQNPNNKMSKSDIDPFGTINILDTEEEIREKVKKAVTDSEVKIDPEINLLEKGHEGIFNLLTIHSAFKNQNFHESWAENAQKSYGEFKQKLADLLVEKLKPIQEKYEEIRGDEQKLRQILDEGRDYAIEKSSKTLEEVKQRVGLL
jgi:tryptophanyl-tRNA synthetase